MLLLIDPSLVPDNVIELHYYFNDETHTMDAVVQNECEYYFLAIAKAIATTLNVEILIETRPLEDGGLVRQFKILAKKEGKNGAITIAIITALLTALIVTPASKTMEHLIDKIFEDKELTELQKEKIRSEIDKNNSETEKNNSETEINKAELLEYRNKSKQLVGNTVVAKNVSNYYETLDSYPKVEKISVANSSDWTKKHFVDRAEFKQYILGSSELPSIQVDDVSIEIVSPVLKKGNYKWRGIYDGEVISFNMKSIEFKSLVTSGQIDFKNGTTINCLVELERKINNDGEEEIANYNVLRVNRYYDNDKPVETPEGKKHRQIVEADRRQLKMFGPDGEPNN